MCFQLQVGKINTSASSLNYGRVSSHESFLLHFCFPKQQTEEYQGVRLHDQLVSSYTASMSLSYWGRDAEVGWGFVDLQTHPSSPHKPQLILSIRTHRSCVGFLMLIIVYSNATFISPCIMIRNCDYTVNNLKYLSYGYVMFTGQVEWVQISLLNLIRDLDTSAYACLILPWPSHLNWRRTKLFHDLTRPKRNLMVGLRNRSPHVP